MTCVSVQFKVKIDELLQKNEKVFICGSVQELGNWYPMKARVLKRQEYSKVNNTEIWSTEVMVPLKDISYRYFIGTSDENHESSDERTINISTWESNIKPRTKHILEHLLNGNTHKTDKNQYSYDIYGFIDDHRRLLRGWLTDQTAVQIRLYGDSIKFYKTAHSSKRLFLNCAYFQMHKSHWSNDTDDDDSSDNNRRNIAKFSMLTDEHFSPTMPPPHGVEFTGEYTIFHIETMDLEDMWIEIEIRMPVTDVSVNHASSSKHRNNNESREFDDSLAFNMPTNGHTDDYVIVGCARMGLMPSEKTIKSISIFNLKNRPIGEIKVEFLAIFPLMGLRYTMAETYQLHWKHRKTLNVGHRGLGPSYDGTKKVSAVRENTLFSLRTAFDHGADYVEFDVQLSKDMIPVLYHDFQVCTVLRKKRKNDLQYLEIPVKDLTLSDLQALKLDPTCVMTDEQRDEKMTLEDIDPLELQPFPTLQSCLEHVPPNMGFNIELKYPQTYAKNGQSEQPNYFDRNLFVDTILKVIANYGGDRRIILSCFDADVCLMVSLKQNKYPVLFLTQGETDAYEKYKDLRAQTLENAMYFAKSANILGLSAFSTMAADRIDVVHQIINKKLILFVWGEDLSNTSEMEHWREIGIHGIIFDRIHEIHQPGSLNIFHLVPSKGQLATLINHSTDDIITDN